MNVYGAGPAADEAEIILFGPGCGEAIAVHLGESQWLLVDSCMHPDAQEPATLHYLRSIGVAPNSVKGIVASHWHDDHIRGISALSDVCKEAVFFLSGIFTDAEAQNFLAAYGGEAAPAQASGAKELYKVVRSRAEVIPAHQYSLLLEVAALGRKIRVWSLSPTHQAQINWTLHMAQYIPRTSGGPINHAPDLSPNLAAVALHIDFGDEAVLLGSDLENHRTTGWPAVLSDHRTKKFAKAAVYKVAHHGSTTGDAPGIWSDLLVKNPVAAMTPFSRSNLPTVSDRERIKALTSEAFLSSAASKRPEIERSQLNRMKDICSNLAKVNVGFGAVRLRKKLGDVNWTSELFGQAIRL